jgi:hypothetical protein
MNARTPQPAAPPSGGFFGPSAAQGVFVRPGFLPPSAMLKVVAALDRLEANWAQSEAMGLLGRGRTGQVDPGNLAAQGQLDEIRETLAPAVLHSAKACGFWFPTLPRLQLFPVRMTGDRLSPAYQEPHTDSYAGVDSAPICTSVFYARCKGIVGGDLAVSRASGDLSDPIRVRPSANTLAAFSGDRVHWVEPLYAGERLSVVFNLY